MKTINNMKAMEMNEEMLEQVNGGIDVGFLVMVCGKAVEKVMEVKKWFDDNSPFHAPWDLDAPIIHRPLELEPQLPNETVPTV